jgi:hypothetical protein
MLCPLRKCSAFLLMGVFLALAAIATTPPVLALGSRPDIGLANAKFRFWHIASIPGLIKRAAIEG